MPIRIEQVPIESETGILIMAIRMKVFVEEQHVPVEYEIDTYDDTATHFAAFADDEIAGTCRLIKKGLSMKIGRVAVLKDHRLQGIGRALMEHAITHARQQKCQTCELTAQLPVIPFYEKLGFLAHGEVFMEVHIPHRAMTLHLQEGGLMTT